MVFSHEETEFKITQLVKGRAKMETPVSCFQKHRLGPSALLLVIVKKQFIFKGE